MFVPEHRLHSVPKAIDNDYRTEHTDETLYRSSFIPVLTLVLAGPQLGLGRAALRYVMEKAPERGISYTKFERQTDSTAFQLQIANAATLIDTAHLHTFRAADDIDQEVYGKALLGFPYEENITPHLTRPSSPAKPPGALISARRMMSLPDVGSAGLGALSAHHQTPATPPEEQRREEGPCSASS